MPDLKDLTKKGWKELKKNAGIKSSGWFKKADASVGKHLEKMAGARERFEGSFEPEPVLEYIEALEALDTAFQSFFDKKKLGEINWEGAKAKEKDELADMINGWRVEISEALKKARDVAQSIHKMMSDEAKVGAYRQLESQSKQQFWKGQGLDAIGF